MTKTIKFTPAKPCCETCVTEAMGNAGFDYTEPFVIISGFAGQAKRSRAALLDSLLDSRSTAIILVSSPVPTKSDEVPPAAVHATEDVSSLDENTMREILGITAEGVGKNEAGVEETAG